MPPVQSAITQQNRNTVIIFNPEPLDFSEKCFKLTAKNPDLSQTPTPNIQVKTIPTAGKVTKFLTTLVKIRTIPLEFNRLVTTTVFPVTGWTSEKPIAEKIQEPTNVAI